MPWAAEWPAEDVVQELRRRDAAISAAQRRGTDTEASSNPIKRPRVDPDADRSAGASATTRSAFALAMATIALDSADDKRRTHSAASPVHKEGLNRTLASRSGAFTAWWNTTSYTILSALGFNKAGADDIHRASMSKINDRFKTLHAGLVQKGKITGTWGDKNSFQSINYGHTGAYLSPYVKDEDLLSVCHNNLATDWAVYTFFRMICFASRTASGSPASGWACVSPQLVPSLIMANNTNPTMTHERDTAREFASGITNEYVNEYGASNLPLWVPITLPGHFILFLYLPDEKMLLVCDPLGTAFAKKRSAEIAAFVAWLKVSHPLTVKFCDVPKQTDATSCGPFCMAYILYALLHGGLPPPSTAWSGANTNCIRAAVATILLTGKVPRPDGGKIDVAGAGLPKA